MKTKTRIGKVRTHDMATGVVECSRKPAHVYFWRGGIIRTSGSVQSVCNIDTQRFDVTVSAATALAAIHGTQLDIEYDDDMPFPAENPPAAPTQNLRFITKFNGEVIVSPFALPVAS